MLGLSPRPYTLTQQQAQTSQAVTAAVPDLPTTVIDLISQMAVPDFSLAEQTLELSEDGELIQHQRNRDILATIEAALTSPSSECDPKTKARIFTNATKTHGVLGFMYGEYHITGMLRPYLVALLNRLTAAGLQINLDRVALNNLDLSLHADQLNLTGMSARGTQFSNISMRHLKLDGVDFTGATFTDTNLSQASLCRARITGATFSNVQFSRTLACELSGDQYGIYQLSSIDSEFSYLAEQRVSTEKTYLYGAFVTAAPDSDSFTLAAQRNIAAKTKEI